MKKIAIAIATFAFMTACFAVETSKPDEFLKTELDKISYSIGLDIGKNFYQQEIQIHNKPFLEGLKHGQTNQTPLMTEEEVRETLMKFQAELMKKQKEAFEKMAKENKEAGDAFLAKNKTKSGVITLDSGLQYRIIKEGTGTPPTLEDTVTTHYRGTLIDGKEFDSSYSRNEPVKFPVNGVIPGWTEALQKMKPGAKWELYIPSNLAYGERGAGQVIGPNSTLIFEIELLSIEPKPAKEPKKSN